MSDSGRNRFSFEEEPPPSKEWVFLDSEEESREPSSGQVYLDEPPPGRKKEERPSPIKKLRQKKIRFIPSLPAIPRSFYRYFIWGGVLILLGGALWGGYTFYKKRFPDSSPLSFLSSSPEKPESRNLKEMEPDGLRDRYYMPGGKVSLPLARAIELYHKGDLDRAKRELNSFVMGSGSDREKSVALIYLGLMAMDTEKFVMARQHLLRALRYDNDSVAALVNLAIVERKLGRYDDARSYGERARKLSPDDNRIAILLGNLKAESQDLAGAIETYEEGIKQSPEDPLLYYNLALSLMRKERIDEAIRYFSKSIELSKGQPLAHRAHAWLGQIYFGKGNLELGAHHLQKAAELAPENARYHYNLGVVYLRMKRSGEALKSFQRALEAGETDPSLLRGLARAFEQLERPGSALRALKQALIKNPQDLEALFMMGDLYYKGKDLLNAADTYRRIVNITPGDDSTADALAKLGTVYLELERPNEAVEIFRRILSIQPKSGGALYSLGVAYSKGGRIDEAVSAWKRALGEGQWESEGGVPLEWNEERMIRLALASIYRKEGGYDLALGQYRQILTLNKRSADHEDDPVLFLEMGRTYMYLKQYNDAISFFDRAAESASASAKDRKEALRNLAVAYGETGRPGDLERARSYATRALRIDPGDATLSILKASLLMKSSSMVDRERAIEILQSVTASDVEAPTASEAYNLLGLAFYSNGEYARAIRAYDYAVQLDPSRTDVYKNQRIAVNAYEASLKR